MTVLSEPGDIGSQRMMMLVNGLLAPSCGPMGVQIQGNEVFSVHDNSSLTSVERWMLLTSRSMKFGSRPEGFPGRLRRRMLCPPSYWGTGLSRRIEAWNDRIGGISRCLM
jgi:hypothetical protein